MHDGLAAIQISIFFVGKPGGKREFGIQGMTDLFEFCHCLACLAAFDPYHSLTVIELFAILAKTDDQRFDRLVKRVEMKVLYYTNDSALFAPLCEPPSDRI